MCKTKVYKSQKSLRPAPIFSYLSINRIGGPLDPPPPLVGLNMFYPLPTLNFKNVLKNFQPFQIIKPPYNYGWESTVFSISFIDPVTKELSFIF